MKLFDEIKAIGNPYHGLVRNGVLQHPINSDVGLMNETPFYTFWQEFEGGQPGPVDPENPSAYDWKKDLVTQRYNGVVIYGKDLGNTYSGWVMQDEDGERWVVNYKFLNTSSDVEVTFKGPMFHVAQLSYQEVNVRTVSIITPRTTLNSGGSSLSNLISGVLYSLCDVSKSGRKAAIIGTGRLISDDSSITYGMYELSITGSVRGGTIAANLAVVKSTTASAEGAKTTTIGRIPREVVFSSTEDPANNVGSITREYSGGSGVDSKAYYSKNLKWAWYNKTESLQYIYRTWNCTYSETYGVTVPTFLHRTFTLNFGRTLTKYKEYANTYVKNWECSLSVTGGGTITYSRSESHSVDFEAEFISDRTGGHAGDQLSEVPLTTYSEITDYELSDTQTSLGIIDAGVTNHGEVTEGSISNFLSTPNDPAPGTSTEAYFKSNSIEVEHVYSGYGHYASAWVKRNSVIVSSIGNSSAGDEVDFQSPQVSTPGGSASTSGSGANYAYNPRSGEVVRSDDNIYFV